MKNNLFRCLTRARNATYLFAFVLLLFVCVFIFLPVSSRAQAAQAETSPFSAGSGSEADPYLLSSPSDLVALSTLVNGAKVRPSDGMPYASLSYRLESDLDMTNVAFEPIGVEGTTETLDIIVDSDGIVFDSDIATYLENDWENFRSYFLYQRNGEYISCDDPTYPLGYDRTQHYYHLYSFERAFFGTFDGNGHTVSGLTIRATDNAGLFGYIANASVSGLTLVQANVSSDGNVGAIVGKAVSSEVTNCVVLSSSLSSSGAGAAVGGGVGFLAPENSYVIVIVNAETLLPHDFDMLPYLTTYCNQPRTGTISACSVVSTDVFSEGNCGGLVGNAVDHTIANCFTDAHLARGNLVYSATNVTLDRCFSVYGSTVATGANVQSVFSLYVADIGTDTVANGVTVEDLLSLPVSQLFGETAPVWTTRSPDGNVFYYPSPNGFYKEYGAYILRLDGEVVLIVHEADLSGQTYSLPDAVVPSGYSFGYYLFEGAEYAPGDTLSVTSSGDVYTYYNVEFTPVYAVPGTDDVTAYYAAEDLPFDSVSVYDTTEYGVSYLWYRSSDGETYAEYSAGEVLTLRNVADSGYFYCKAVANVGEKRISNDDFVDMDVLYCEVIPQSATLSPVGTYLGSDAVTYTGSTFSLDLTYTQTGVFAADEDTLSVVYSIRNGNDEVVKNAGTYVVSAASANGNYSFTVENALFTVLPAGLTVTASDKEVTYDGTTRSFGVDLVETVDGCEPVVLYSLDGESFGTAPTFSDRTENVSVYYTITADNHESVSGSFSVTVLPLSVEFTADPEAPVLTKTYDGTALFPAEDVTGDLFAASHTGAFSGEIPYRILSATADSSRSGNVSVTVRFGFDNDNFTAENDSVVLSGRIEKGVVSVRALRSVTAEYNGSNDYSFAVSTDDYGIECDSSVLPDVYVYLAVPNDKNVPLASTLTVTFTMSGDDFLFAENGNVATFDLTLTKKTLTLDASKLFVTDRRYDGSTDVEVTIGSGALVGVVANDSPVLHIEKGVIPSPYASETPYDVSLVGVELISDNYSLAEQDVVLTVTISKADPVLHPTCASEVVFRSSRTLPEVSFADGDTSGHAVWDIPEIETADDWDELVSSGHVTASFTFIPEDSVDYNEIQVERTFAFEEIALVSLSYDPEYSDTYVAFEVFDTSVFALTAAYNDGTERTVCYSLDYDGFDLTYPSGKGYFTVADTYVTARYDGMSVNIPVTVRQAVFTVSSSEVSYAYNGIPRTFYPDGFDPAYMSITGNVETNAGTYTAVLSFTEEFADDCLFADNRSSLSIPWRVTPLAGYAPFLSPRSFVYSGEPCSVVVRNDYNRSADFFDVSGVLSATNAGVYTVTFTLKNSNYYWYEYPETSTFGLEWRIFQQVVAVPEVFDLPFVYDGKNHTVTVTDSDAYTLSGDLTYRNAGSYAVTATLKDNVNFVWQNNSSEPAVIRYDVAKIKVDKPAVTGRSFVYSGNANSLRVPLSDDYVVTGDLVKRNAGVYTAVVSLTDAVNTVWSDGTDAPIVVEWSVRRLIVTLPSLLGSVYYTGSEVRAPIAANTQYCQLSGNTAVQAGTYTANIALKDTVNTSWTDGSVRSVSLVWVLSPSLVDKPNAPENAVYNGLEQTASVVSNSAYVISGNVQTGPGTFTVSVRLLDKNNYAWTDGTANDLSFAWKICALSLSSEGEVTMNTTYAVGDELPVPFRAGYAFEGWYLNASFTGDAVTVLDEINENTTLYAKWRKTSSGGSSISLPGDTKNNPALSEKAIIGLSIGGGAFVIAIMIVVLGMVLRRR